MSKQDVLNRVTVKSVKNEVKPVASVDLNAPAHGRQTWALYQANRAASKINGCKVFNDWHEQGLTVGEFIELINEYNKVTGRVYPSPSKGKAKTKTVSVNENLRAKQVKGKVSKAVTKESPLSNRPINHELVKAQIEALKDLRKEGLLSVAELTEALKGLQY